MWTIVAAAVLLVVWRAAHLLILAFGSVVGAVIFLSAAELFEKLGIRNDKVRLVLGTVLALALFGVIAWLLGVQFGGEISGILDNLPETLHSIEATFDKSAVGRAIVQAFHSTMGGGTIADRLGTLMLGAGQLLINFVIMVVGAMFISASPKLYKSGLVLLTPPKGRAAVRRALGEIGEALQLWLKAKLITMSIMGALISLGLWIAGLDSWAALGLLGGLSEFVPYVGPTIAMVPSIGLAAAAGDNVLWRTIVAYIIVRLIEAYALTPWVNQEVVDIPPALTLFVILAVGVVFGIYGVFFAGAFLVVAYVGVRELYLHDTLGEDIEGLADDAED